jgi:hypothetical protein
MTLLSLLAAVEEVERAEPVVRAWGQVPAPVLEEASVLVTEQAIAGSDRVVPQDQDGVMVPAMERVKAASDPETAQVIRAQDRPMVQGMVLATARAEADSEQAAAVEQAEANRAEQL